MPAMKAGIPRIDPNVQFVGVSKLRALNATNLNNLDKTLVVQDANDKPLAVILRYEQFLEMQQERDKVLETLETLFSDDSFLGAMQDAQNGRVKPMSEVERKLRKRSEKPPDED